MNALEPAIEARGVSRRFGALTVVDQLDLTVPRAHIYGFLGPNGSGKTTTIRMLCGLLRPSAGSIRVLGHEIPRDAEALRTRIGYMTQKFSLWDDLTVLENLRFIAQIYTLERPRTEARIAAVLGEFDLEDLRNRQAARMSGGQRQRLALAAATLHEPELLMLDEPTSAVDPQSRRDFWESLFALVARGTTILVSTHYMDEAERCHRLAILAAGRLVAEGEPETLMRGLPQHVIEVQGEPIEAIRTALRQAPQILSVAQLGLRLHALVTRDTPDPIALVRDVLAARNLQALVVATHANLEDVFVSATLPGAARERAA